LLVVIALKYESGASNARQNSDVAVTVAG
jgi:hypothetical protein